MPFHFAVPFHPFEHQNRAWLRLSSQDQAPRSAIVTTGTGSGKTECLGSDYRERWRRFLSVLNLLQFWGNFRFWTSSEADDEAPEIPLEAATALAEAWQAVLDEVVPSLQPYIHELAAAGLPVSESLAEVEHYNDHVPQSAWSNQASDGYRAIVIVPEKGDTYILVHIDSYDRAYQGARHKRFEAHQRFEPHQMTGNG